MFMCPERSFSTREIAPAKRLGAWQEMISDVFFKVDIDGAKVEDDWRASIDEVRLGDLGLSTYATESAKGTRSRAAIAGEGEESYILVSPISGSMYYYQYARNGIIRGGDYVLLSSGDYYQLSCDEPFQGLFLKVPAAVMDASYGEVRTHCAGGRPPNRSLSAVLRSLVLSVGALMPAERAAYAPGLQRQVLGLMSLMLQSEPAADGALSLAQHRLYQRVTAFIGHRFADEDLTARLAARELGISVGYLHRVLQANGTSFGRLLRDARLAHAYEALSRPGTAGKRVGDIAYAAGFSDHSLFSRAFKQRFGLTPRQCLAAD